MKLTWKVGLKIVAVVIVTLAALKLAADNDVPGAEELAEAVGLDV